MHPFFQFSIFITLGCVVIMALCATCSNKKEKESFSFIDATALELEKLDSIFHRRIATYQHLIDENIEVKTELLFLTEIEVELLQLEIKVRELEYSKDSIIHEQIKLLISPYIQ